MASSNVLLANNEWIEVTPGVKVSGPSHKVFFAGIVSNQPEHDSRDIRVEEVDGKHKTFINRRNDQDEDRVFTITYGVNAHGADYFTNMRIVVHNPNAG